MGKTKKDVKPISARQTGELARLLEERGMDKEIFQRTMLENPDGLCFFLRGKALGGLFGKTVTIKEENGWVIEIVDGKIFGAALNLGEYAQGNIFRVGDIVEIKKEIIGDKFYAPRFPVGSKGVIESIKFNNFDRKIIYVRFDNRKDVYVRFDSIDLLNLRID